MTITRARNVLRLPASYSNAQAARAAQLRQRALTLTSPLRLSVACATLIAAS